MRTEKHPRGALFTALRELVAALDRRQPQRDSQRERDIVRDANSLRGAAVDRVAAMQRDDELASMSADVDLVDTR